MSDWLQVSKVELHCHLLGIISPRLLRSIHQEGGAILVDPGDLEAIYPVSSVASFQRWVDILRPYQSAPPELMRPVLAAHAAALIAQRVVYTEIMLSPAMFASEKRALLAAFHRWRDWTFEAEAGKVQIEYLLVVPRTLSPEALERDTALFIELKRENLIAGVALVGIESGASLARFTSSFLRWRDAGLGIEVHAGEHSGPESVRDALQHGFPDRLGHAVSAFRDHELIDQIRSAGIHIEFCLTSNLRTGAVPEMSAHPASVAKQRALSFSLNTDDPGAFDCSMNGEYRHAADTFGFTREDFQKVFCDSLAARFAPELRYMRCP